MWEQKEVRESLQDGSRDWVTAVAYVCAYESVLPPNLIFEAANKAIQSAWVDSINAANHSVLISSSSTGWSKNDTGLAWLEQAFDRYTKAKAQRHRRLLILDGHDRILLWILSITAIVTESYWPDFHYTHPYIPTTRCSIVQTTIYCPLT
jgi:hypothetical protein